MHFETNAINTMIYIRNHELRVPIKSVLEQRITYLLYSSLPTFCECKLKQITRYTFLK